uniref:poly-beta-1,6 N-acetyl-D-glucosamine export porin PgaA n=1 Tax=unclassified Variovorax TaxID=663243 RepID=UPI000D3FA00B
MVAPLAVRAQPGQAVAQAPVPTHPQAVPAGYTAEAHDTLVAQVRAGRMAPADALAVLADWFPQAMSDAQRERIASDAVVWALQADQPQEAVRWVRAVPLARLADYAFEPAFVAARRTDDRILQLHLSALGPTQRVVRRENAFALDGMGSPTEALAQAEAAERTAPGSFSGFELASLRQQALGQRLRWAIGERNQRAGEGAAGRFERIDELLPLYEPELQAAEGHAAEAGWQALYLRLYADHLTALSARGRFAEVTAGYAQWQARHPDAPLPYYALSDVAGAYQQQRRSDLAVPLYEQALRSGGDAIPVPSDTHTGLVYAYLDTARFDDAESLLRQLEAATPPLLRLTPEQGRANPEYAEVSNLRALYQLYTERPWQAETSFRGLTSLAPLNSGFRAGLAETMKLRDKPDEALGRYRETLVDHPWDVPARAGYAGALFDAGEIRAGRELTDSLQAEAPESIAVRNAVAQRDTLRAPRLDVDADAGQGHGASVLADRDWRVDAKLSSPLWDDRWRLFFRQVFARGDTSLGNAELSRSGIGVEYLQGRWQASAELHQADRGRYRTGVALGLDYRASDAWRWSARFDSNSLDTPWKARLAGVGARSLELGGTYVVNESRAFTARVERMDFSDGNGRDALGLGWRERLVSGPRFQLEGTLSGETARYARQDVAYFAPRGESALQVGLTAKYLGWKRDDQRFSHVAGLEAGSYRQQGFGSGALWSVRYGHEWVFGRSATLAYGLGIASHPYDGVRERRRFVYLNLSVPFQ